MANVLPFLTCTKILLLLNMYMDGLLPDLLSDLLPDLLPDRLPGLVSTLNSDLLSTNVFFDFDTPCLLHLL